MFTALRVPSRLQLNQLLVMLPGIRLAWAARRHAQVGAERYGDGNDCSKTRYAVPASSYANMHSSLRDGSLSLSSSLSRQATGWRLVVSTW